MDQKFEAYLQGLVTDILNSPMFVNIPEDQKITLSEKIKNHLNGVVIDAIVDRLNSEQLNAIKDLPADSPEMEEKIEEFAAQMPNLADELEQKLNQAVENLKQNPQSLN